MINFVCQQNKTKDIVSIVQSKLFGMANSFPSEETPHQQQQKQSNKRAKIIMICLVCCPAHIQHRKMKKIKNGKCTLK